MKTNKDKKSRFADLTEQSVEKAVEQLSKPQEATRKPEKAKKEAVNQAETPKTQQGRGRPRNNKKAFTSSLDPELRMKLDILAATKGNSVADTLEEILLFYFSEVETVQIPKVTKKFKPN